MTVGQLLVRRSAVAAWWAGIVVVGLIAAAGGLQLAARLAALWRDFPGDLGVLGMLGVVVIGAAGAAVALLHLRDGRLRRWMPWTGLVLVLLVRLPVVLLLETRLSPDTDPAILEGLAREVLGGRDPLVAHRPMAYSSMIAGLYALFGIDPQLAELLNLGFGLLTAAMLWLFVARCWNRGTADVALVLYALTPSAIFFTPLVFTETVYAGPVLAALAALAVALVPSRSAADPERRPPVRAVVVFSVLSGLMLGLSQYVRPLSQALLGAWLAVPLLAGVPWRRAAVIALLTTATFVGVLLPVAAHNLRAHGELSVSTSSYGGWSIFVGANQEHDGRFNRDDQAISLTLPGTSEWARSAAAGRLGIQRIAEDPRGFADLVVRKFWVQWADDSYGATYALSLPYVDGRTKEIFGLLSQVFYAGLAAAAAATLVRGRNRRPLGAFLLAIMVVIVVAAHVLVEVQPRYHAYVIPLLVGLAAPLVAGWSAQRRKSGASSSNSA